MNKLSNKNFLDEIDTLIDMLKLLILLLEKVRDLRANQERIILTLQLLNKQLDDYYRYQEIARKQKNITS